MVGLLEAAVPSFRATQRRQLAGLLGVKSEVAYSQRMLGVEEARRLVDQSGRFLRWVGRIVESSLG